MIAYFILAKTKIGYFYAVAGVFLAALAFSAQAAPPRSLYFDHVKQFDSSPAIQSLIQDRQGYIWVGTNEGLFRHDGYEFV